MCDCKSPNCPARRAVPAQRGAWRDQLRAAAKSTDDPGVAAQLLDASDLSKTDRKERKMAKKKLEKSAGISPADANAAISTALARLTKAAAEADEAGNAYRARDLRRERAALKLGQIERARKGAGPMAAAFGVPVVANARALPDDPSIAGV